MDTIEAILLGRSEMCKELEWVVSYRQCAYAFIDPVEQLHSV